MLEDDSASNQNGNPDARAAEQLNEKIIQWGTAAKTITALQDGAEALDLYSRSQRAGRPFDLVLLDLTIRGGMGGRETLEKLKNVDPGVVAVVTSGYADDPVIAEFGQHGFQGSIGQALQHQNARADHCASWCQRYVEGLGKK